MKLATTILVFSVAGLLTIGTVMLYSSPQGARLLPQQFLWVVLGFAACAAAALIDYRHLKKFSVPLLVVSVALLAAVFVPGVGKLVNGARRWLDLGPMNFQPSEVAKLAVIILTAHYAEFFQRKMHTLWKGLLVPAVFVGPVLGLIFLEPDYGTTVLLAGVVAAMLITAGARLTYVGAAMVAGVIAIGISILNNPVRLERMLAFFHPEQHREGKGFQQHQATIALGSGGVTGVGLGDGRQKFGYVPENHTDFIFSIVGEELGLVATLFIVGAFMAIILCCVFIALRASDRFGMLLASGISFLIGFQAFINIGVVTGVLPNKGLPLPFVSYGGSNLLVLLTTVGLLLSIARRATEPATRQRFNPFSSGEIPSTRIS